MNTSPSETRGGGQTRAKLLDPRLEGRFVKIRRANAPQRNVHSAPTRANVDTTPGAGYQATIKAASSKDSQKILWLLHASLGGRCRSE